MCTATLFIGACLLAAVPLVSSQQVPCGGSVTVVSGIPSVIRSPNYPDKYPNGIRCQWTISAPSGKALSFQAKSFRLEGGGSTCPYDVLTVNGVKFCGTNGTIGFVTSSPASVSFITDYSISYSGFEIEITDVEIPDKTCGGKINVDSGKTVSLVSPGFPANYPDNKRCVWTVIGPAGKSLQIDNVSFALEEEYNCAYDSLTFAERINGQPVQLAKLCGNNGPKIRSTTNNVTIEFASDSTVNMQGFNITIREATDCTGENCKVKCGIPSITPNLNLTKIVNGKIVGGAEAVPHSWPWQIAFTSAEGVQFCGGSLIDRNWVLTAAHCCDHREPSSSRVRVGVHNLYAQESTAKTFGLKRIISHPLYNGSTMNYDFCLLELAEPAQYGQAVSPVCLARDIDDAAGTKCYLSGWGGTEARGSATLQQVHVSLVAQTACVTAYSSGLPIQPSMICGTAPGKDTCQGDSGGPLVCPRADGQAGFVLVGATSWGIGCARPNYPGVYSRVSYVREWIASITSL